MKSTSRLSSLLVRDGVVDVRRMEKAFQRQVLFDGGLDTILLEMNELNEQRLLQYLSLATGLPPAGARELEGLEPRAAKSCPRDLAERFEIVPLSFDGDALRVLTRDPADLGALEDLASELGVPVQPFVAPEFRFELAFDRVFGRQSAERFTRLAEASRLSAIPPVGRPPSVVVGTLAEPPPQPVAEAPAPVSEPEPVASEPEPVAASEPEPVAAESAPEPAPEVAPAPSMLAEPPAGDAPSSMPLFGRRTLQMTSETVRQRHQETERQAADAFRRSSVDDTVPDAERQSDPDAGSEVVIEYDTPDSGAMTAPLPRAGEDGRPVGIVSGEIGPNEASGPPVEAAPPAPSGPVASPESGSTTQAFRRMAGFDPRPLAMSEARAMLAQADHRDVVFETLLRAIRAHTWYVGILTVQGGAAIGRIAIAGDEVEQTEIGQVLIPLDTPSSFRQAVNTASPYIGPVATGDREIDAMIRRMGGVIPPSAMLLPLVLKNRVVALLIGHRGADMLRVTEVSELLPLAGAASEALG
ncbi:MAG TPA: hypothetical protein VNO33_11250, partial [Kofleriaceae bacterium]|nr:hypothetical protein [Kofleriaceae bacterium]